MFKTKHISIAISAFKMRLAYTGATYLHNFFVKKFAYLKKELLIYTNKPLFFIFLFFYGQLFEQELPLSVYTETGACFRAQFATT